MLNACLACVDAQDGEKQVFVCDNDPNYNGHTPGRYATGAAGCKTCYESANHMAPYATGDWLCFPSDDSLYVQGFSRIMLETAERTGADMVYCDCVYHRPDSSHWKPYTVLDVQPSIGRIDKTCFILRRELFNGFPPHPRGYCDGALIEQLVSDGVRHAKAPGILVVHQ